MIESVFLVVGGLLILVFAGDALVRGAVNMSLKLGVPALIVSLTIVAFGTSAPELLVSLQAIGEGSPGLALGNVVGSNIANVLLVLGVPALISRLHTKGSDTKESYVTMMVASAIFIVLAFFGPFTWWHGIILLTMLAIILGRQIRDGLRQRRTVPEDEIEGAAPGIGWGRITIYLVIGLIGLPLGADLLVEGSVNIARAFGVSEAVIGLTLVAIGTSLPELATSVMAAIRREADVALGNVIGSNIFNLLAIIGITSLVGPIPVDPVFLHLDLWVMLAASALLFPFAFSCSSDIGRRWGTVFVTAYAVYLFMTLASGGAA